MIWAAIIAVCAFGLGWCCNNIRRSYQRHRQFRRISQEVNRRLNTDRDDTHPIRRTPTPR